MASSAARPSKRSILAGLARVDALGWRAYIAIAMNSSIKTPPRKTSIGDLNERSRDIFRAIVEAYVSSGAPIGSRTLSRQLGMSLSPATIRNVMADLEDLGLLFAPHTSAGRLPTDMGLRLFVDGNGVDVRCADKARLNTGFVCLINGTAYQVSGSLSAETLDAMQRFIDRDQSSD